MFSRWFRWVAVAAIASVLGVSYARPQIVVELVSGATCSGVVCTDASARVGQAAALYEDAQRFVAVNVEKLSSRPVTVFCATERCYRSFGFSDASAKSVGGTIIVLGPNAWKPYYVRHELIHQIQSQQLGTLRMFSEPAWFIEGMAYSLSDDPRRPLAEPFESYRARFDAWHQSVQNADFWDAARRL